MKTVVAGPPHQFVREKNVYLACSAMSNRNNSQHQGHLGCFGSHNSDRKSKAWTKPSALWVLNALRWAANTSSTFSGDFNKWDPEPGAFLQGNVEGDGTSWRVSLEQSWRRSEAKRWGWSCQSHRRKAKVRAMVMTALVVGGAEEGILLVIILQCGGMMTSTY